MWTIEVLNVSFAPGVLRVNTVILSVPEKEQKLFVSAPGKVKTRWANIQLEDMSLDTLLALVDVFRHIKLHHVLINGSPVT